MTDNTNIYVKATGANRYAGGSHNWLKIRGLEKTKTGYTIKVRIKWGTRYIDCSKDMITPNLIFMYNNQYINLKDVIDLMGD